MEIEGIKKIISRYRYGKLDIGDRLEIKRNPYDCGIKIDNFYNHDNLEKRGDCSELSNTAYHEIKDIYPNYNVLRAVGNEPFYFNVGCQTTWNHSFLLLSEEKNMKSPHTKNKFEIADVLKNEPMVVDPSLGVVKKYIDSGYSVRELFNEDCHIIHQKYVTINKVSCVPVALKDGMTINLSSDDNGLSVRFMFGGETEKNYSIYSEELDEEISDDLEIKKFIDEMRDKEITITKEKLPENKCGLVFLSAKKPTFGEIVRKRYL